MIDAVKLIFEIIGFFMTVGWGFGVGFWLAKKMLD